MDKLLKRDKARRHIGAEVENLLADEIILYSLINGVSKSKVITCALESYLEDVDVEIMVKNLVSAILRRAERGLFLDNPKSFLENIEEGLRGSGMSVTICDDIMKEIRGKVNAKKKK